MYKVFIRNWWKMQNGKLAPNLGGRKTHLTYTHTEEEARRVCKQYNESHDPGRLSRKAEYTRV